MRRPVVAEKFKSKLREKFRAVAKKDKAGGRSLSYGSSRVRYGDNEVTVPKPQRKAYFDQVKGTVVNKVKTATKKKAKEALSARVKKGSEQAEKGLTGVRHPAQLIPAIKASGTLSSIIKAFLK